MKVFIIRFSWWTKFFTICRCATSKESASVGYDTQVWRVAVKVNFLLSRSGGEIERRLISTYIKSISKLVKVAISKVRTTVILDTETRKVTIVRTYVINTNDPLIVVVELRVCTEDLNWLSAIGCYRSVNVKETCTSALPKTIRLNWVSIGEHVSCFIVKYKVLEVVIRITYLTWITGTTFSWVLFLIFPASSCHINTRFPSYKYRSCTLEIQSAFCRNFIGVKLFAAGRRIQKE